MSGSTIGGIVGGGIGWLVGGPAGARWGFMIGSALGGIVDPEKIRGPRLTDGQTVTSQEGIPILFGYGTFPGGGNVIWADDLVEHEQKEGGKGGPQQISYTYTRSYAVGICEGEITAIVKAWRNGKLVYDVTPTSTITSENTKFLRNHTFYTGSESQLVDPTIEAAVGVGNSPPMRGLAYMVAEDEDLTDSGGAIAQWRFAVQKCGTVTDLIDDRILFIASGNVNEVRTTATGTTWTDRSTGLAGVEIYQVAAQADAAVGSAVTGHFYYSTDQGVSWTISSTGPFTGSDSFAIIDIAMGGAYSVAITRKNDGPRTCTTIVSTDGGVTWTEHAAPFNDATAIAFGQDSFVVVTGVDGDGIWSSPNGITWTNRSATFELYGVAYNGTNFMAVGESGKSFWSLDGAGWTYGGSSPGGVSWSFVEVCGQDGYFIAGTNAVAGIFKSTDLGASWTQKQAAGACEAAASGMGVDLMATGTAAYFSVDGGESWVNRQPSVNVVDVAFRHPDPRWYVVPDGVNVYADEDGNLISDYALGTQVSACTAFLDDIVADLCERAGIDATEYDVTDLASIEIKGYACATESSAQGFIEPLTHGFFFDRGEWDKKLRFVLRGGAAVAALDMDDLLARDGAAIEQTRVQEVELLRKVNVMTLDPDAEFNATKQSWERRVGTIQARGESSVEVPIVTDKDTAAQIAEKMGKVAWAETEKFNYGLTLAHTDLTPTDVVTLTDSAGEVHRQRIQSRDELAGAITIGEAMKDRPSTYGSTATGVQNPNVPGENDGQLVGPTLFAAMALPMLRSQDDTPGLYVGLCGILPGWPGAQLLMSLDGGLSYTVALSVTEPTIMGELTADETSGDLLQVRVFGGQLASATSAQIDVGANWSGIETAGVAEIVAYETATPTGTRTYDLTDVHRALDDTLVANHLAGDTFMDLNTAYYLPIPQSMAGETIYFKAVGFGVSPDAVDAVPVDWAGVEYVEDGGLVT